MKNYSFEFSMQVNFEVNPLESRVVLFVLDLKATATIGKFLRNLTAKCDIHVGVCTFCS